ncbi:energy transducer TonB [Novosphingobium pokkalii]|uniref:Energy transducer TonB n=1 Tax=Novosphingobium pokkalii TaxID=1770194 RepID=A0ABV7V9Y1_9SPHN|nr:TonB family protein [Novosphingobium pokkalii]
MLEESVQGQGQPTRRPHRLFAASLAAAIEVAVALALWLGLAPLRGVRQALPETLAAIDLTRPPPPPPVTPPLPRPHHHTPAGRAAPANTRAKAAPVYAPLVPVAKPPPIPVAPLVALGADTHSGAAPTPGPGTGAGGQGNGTGSGSSGNGDGDGGQDPEWTGGRIKPSDYPLAAREAHAQGTTSVTLTITPQGRASACRVTHSSGNPALDTTTCTLALQRFRFRPARDAAGHAVAGEVDYDQEWTMGAIADGG